MGTSEEAIKIFYLLLQVVFFQGVTSALRKEVWPYLLHVYSFSLTETAKKSQFQRMSEDYQQIDSERYDILMGMSS